MQLWWSEMTGVLVCFVLTNLPASRVSLLLRLGHAELEAVLGVSLQTLPNEGEQSFPTHQLACSAWVLTIYIVFVWLSEQLTCQHLTGIVSPILTATPGRIKDSDVLLLQGKLRHRKVIVVVVPQEAWFWGQLNLLYSRVSFQPGVPDTLYTGRRICLSFLGLCFLLLACTVLAGCSQQGRFSTPKAARLGSTAVWAEIPQLHNEMLLPDFSWLDTETRCMLIMFWVTVLNNPGLCRVPAPIMHWNQPPHLSCTSPPLSVPWFSITVSPMVLKVDGGKDEAFRMGYT